MPLKSNNDVFITCAVTGSGNTQNRSFEVSRSPKKIADSAIWKRVSHHATQSSIVS